MINHQPTLIRIRVTVGVESGMEFLVSCFLPFAWLVASVACMLNGCLVLFYLITRIDFFLVIPAYILITLYLLVATFLVHKNMKEYSGKLHDKEKKK